MLHDLLVAVDGSVASGRALDHAIELAQDGRARLTLVHAVPEPPPTTVLAGVDPQELREQADRDGERLLCAATEAVPTHLAVTRVLRHGFAGRALVELARTGRYDLVVVGHEERCRLGRLLHRSVSRYLRRRCPCPVVVVAAPAGRAEPAAAPLAPVVRPA
jgi:nucleotide-binding universal stress UspA family protein